MKRSILILAAQFFVFQLVFAQYDSLTLKLDSILDKAKIPGAQLIIVSSDSILWKKNFGLADLEKDLPVTDETMFRIGSVTKSFIGLGAMMQVEQGKLNLKDRVADLAPEVPFENRWAATDPILVEHLLEHTTGFDDMHLVEYGTNGDGWTTLEGLQFHPKSKRSRWRPGMHMSYCNSGPPMAAFILEKITGQTIEDYVAANIFKPLGMQKSSMLLTDEVQANLSKGYYGEDNKEASYWHIISRAAGSINSNAVEMAAYLQMYLNRGRHDSLQLVTPESIERMQRSETTLAGKAGAKEGYGLHIVCSKHKGTNYYWHNGGMTGFLTDMRYIPSLDIGYFLVINKNSPAFGKLTSTVLDHLIDPDGLWTAPEHQAAEYDEEVPGFYRSATVRNQMVRFLDWPFNIYRIKEKDGRLFGGSLSESSNPLHRGEDGFLRRYNKAGGATPVVIAKAPDGETYLQFSANGENYVKTTAFAAWAPQILTFILAALMISALPISLVSIAMKLAGRPIRFLRLRIFPLLAVLSLAAMLILLVMAQTVGDVIENLAKASGWSVGIMICSLLFGAFSLLSFFDCGRAYRVDVHKGARLYYLLVSLACMIVATYFTYWGVMGIRTWT